VLLPLTNLNPTTQTHTHSLSLSLSHSHHPHPTLLITTNNQRAASAAGGPEPGAPAPHHAARAARRRRRLHRRCARAALGAAAPGGGVPAAADACGGGAGGGEEEALGQVRGWAWAWRVLRDVLGGGLGVTDRIGCGVVGLLRWQRCDWVVGSSAAFAGWYNCFVDGGSSVVQQRRIHDSRTPHPCLDTGKSGWPKRSSR